MVAVSQEDTGRGCIRTNTTPLGPNRLSEWAYNEQAEAVAIGSDLPVHNA
jgi:hypothetical protein